jgi:L-cysteine desulfidase
MADRFEDIYTVLNEQVRPALGCTDPGVIALATATARKHLKGPLTKVKLTLSVNVFKNASAARIPWLGESGIPLAALLGALSGDADAGLEVLKTVTEKDVVEAKRMVGEDFVDIKVKQICPDLFVEAHLYSNAETAFVRIEDDYTNITLIKENSEIVFQQNCDNRECPLKNYDITQINEIIKNIPLDKFGFLLKGLEMNNALALLGLECKYGMGVGKSLNKLTEKYHIPQNPLTSVRKLTAAAVDARMGGADLPAMSTGGSGNQGICAFLPIGIVADYFDIGPDKKLRGLLYSNLLAIYAKEFMGRLGGACGVAICAGIGVAAATTWMLGGTDKQITAAVNNLAGNLSGMVCDGGKPGCALKVSTCAAEAVLAAFLALDGVEIEQSDGIIGGSVQKTLENIADVCYHGMLETNSCIYKIIKDKMIQEGKEGVTDKCQKFNVL